MFMKERNSVENVLKGGERNGIKRKERSRRSPHDGRSKKGHGEHGHRHPGKGRRNLDRPVSEQRTHRVNQEGLGVTAISIPPNCAGTGKGLSPPFARARLPRSLEGWRREKKDERKKEGRKEGRD